MELGERKRLSSASLEVDGREENKLKRGVPQDSTSSPKLDRYRLARQLTEKAIKEKKIFFLHGHYPVVRAALRRRGWVEKRAHTLPRAGAHGDEGEGAAESKRAEGKENQEVALEKTEDIHDVMSRLVKNETPYLLWTIKRDVVDCHSLGCDQMLNHYGKTASFTTKIGLCLNLRSLPWYVQADPDTFFPRCYGLCTESEKQGFLDDFRRTAASSILKWVVSHQDGGRSKAKRGREEAGGSDPSGEAGEAGAENAASELTGLSEQLVDTACRVCQAYLGQLEHEDVDVAEDAAERLTEDEWEDLTRQYYALVHLQDVKLDPVHVRCSMGGVGRSPPSRPPRSGDAFISNSRSHYSQCQDLLNKISSVNPQTEIDGLQNIWIVKPAAKSRGRDIVCMNRVEEILELVAADHLSTKDHKWVVQKYIETPLLICDTKFDIRQWFLVTDWNPLTIWFYKESYLRFSTQRFSLDNLDSAIHLCNNSIQKHLKNARDRSPLLPGHNMWTSARFQEYLQKRGRGSLWSSLIYPSMKRAIANTMKVAQEHVEARRNSFELYGADFVLGRDFRPWLIEINSSPTMHASTPVTAQLCAQVQEDTIKVVLDRRADRSCDVGSFELLWRQPAVDPPPLHGPDLCVEGVGVRRGRRHAAPGPGASFPAPLSDSQPPKARRPSALPDLAPGPPQTAAPQDPRLKDAKVLAPRGLPDPLPRPPDAVKRSAPARSTEPAAGRGAGADSEAAKPGPAAAQPRARADPRAWRAPPPAAALPSVKTAPAAPSPLPRPPGLPGGLPAPCLVCCGSLLPTRPCKRCRSFRASVLQGASFVPLGGPGGPWTP